MLSNVLNVFRPFAILLLRILCLDLYPIFVIELFGSLMPLYILEISPLSNVWLVKIFHHTVDCPFVLVTVSFALQKLLSFRRSHLLTVAFNICPYTYLYNALEPV